MKPTPPEILKTMDTLRVDAQKYPDGKILEMTYAQSVVRIAQRIAFDNWSRQANKKAP